MSDESAARPAPVRVPRFGLSGKLLVLTILFVMIAEVLIYFPSIANFRIVWLRDHLKVGKTAAYVLEAAPNGMVPDVLAKKILDTIGARSVGLKMGTEHLLLQPSDVDLPPIADVYDLRGVNRFRAITSPPSIVDAFKTMLNTKDDVMRVVGDAPMGGDYIDLVMDEQPLRDAMWIYSTDILLISLL